MTGKLRALCLGLAWVTLPVFGQVVPDLYIVELSGEPGIAPAGKSGAREASGDRRARVLAEQSAARLAIEAVEAEVLASVQHVANALVVRIPDSRAGRLSGLPGVLRVHPVREARLELDQALPLHRIPEAWQQLGGSSRAGAGIKIGLIDSGIETSHPGFDDPSLPALEGYPRTRSTTDESALNGKIIVMRDYGTLVDATAAADPKDHNGHGTAVAMIAAGMPVSGPYGTMSGVAPKAYLGVYKVFPGSNGNTREDVVIKALDDAVADGMDVVNISLGVEPAQRVEDDLLVAAVERAAEAGVIVVKSAGNSGPTPNTLSSPGGAPSGITVGAQWNQRDFADPAAQVGGKLFPAVPGSGPNSPAPIEAPLADVARLDPSGLACGALAADSLAGKIAVILRGDCVFEEKLNNAMRAGAVAALVYTDAARPDPVIMAVGAATLPGVMVSHASGLEIKEMLGAEQPVSARLRFDVEAVPVNPLRLASFSSRGPSSAYGVKPDLVAAGVAIVTAAQSLDKNGGLYSGTRYTVTDGTSFSSPLTAGAAAVLKSARPGLTAAQYRSLLINSATPLADDPNAQNPAQQAGAGMLNLDAALRNTVAVAPVSLSFGVGDGSPDRSRDLTVQNLDTSADRLTVTVEPAESAPTALVSVSEADLGAGESVKLRVSLSARDLAPGEYQGILRIRGARGGVETRIPYWYAVPSNQLIHIHTVTSTSSTPTIYARAADAAGIVVGGLQPAVTVLSGGGSVGSITSADSLYPGYWRVRVQLGPNGRSTFRVQFGEVSKEVTVTSGN
ncbi:MAG: S8 family serine peptidase [Acidobacteria bacterium]|nr:S8 family serine peptidase [Acidobacteriota bacterium]